MKLLFDENVSPKLVESLATEYPGSARVLNAGLAGATDAAVWSFAATNDFALVTKDSDFRQRSFLEGFPPKVIWLGVGNARTRDIAAILRSELTRVLMFEKDQESSLLVLSLG